MFAENTRVGSPHDPCAFHTGSKREKASEGSGRGLQIMRSGDLLTIDLRSNIVESKRSPKNPCLSESFCFINCDQTFTFYSISFIPQNHSWKFGVIRLFKLEAAQWNNLLPHRSHVLGSYRTLT